MTLSLACRAFVLCVRALGSLEQEGKVRQGSWSFKCIALMVVNRALSCLGISV